VPAIVRRWHVASKVGQRDIKVRMPWALQHDPALAPWALDAIPPIETARFHHAAWRRGDRLHWPTK